MRALPTLNAGIKFEIRSTKLETNSNVQIETYQLRRGFDNRIRGSDGPVGFSVASRGGIHGRTLGNPESVIRIALFKPLNGGSHVGIHGKS
jgi:hypothetical protein